MTIFIGIWLVGVLIGVPAFLYFGPSLAIRYFSKTSEDIDSPEFNGLMLGITCLIMLWLFVIPFAVTAGIVTWLRNAGIRRAKRND